MNWIPTVETYFNSRSYEGSDHPDDKYKAEFDKFQSALPRGERLLQNLLSAYTQNISIRAPARGATKFVFGISVLGVYFNPRSREGSDEIFRRR